MAATKQALVTASITAEELRLRLPTLTITEGSGTSGDPTITVGTPTAGGAFVRIVAESTVQLNALGLAQQVYAPHIIQVCFEADSTLTTVATMPTASIVQLMQALESKGMLVQVYMVADGGTPNEAALTAANLKQTVDASLYFKIKSQI